MSKRLTLSDARSELNKLGIDNNYTNYPHGDKNDDPQAIIIYEKPVSTYLKRRLFGLSVQKKIKKNWRIVKRLHSIEELIEYFHKYGSKSR